MSTRLLCTLLLFVSLCVPFREAAAQEKSKQEQIRQFLQEENYAEARPLIEQVLREDTLLPDNERLGLIFQLAYALSNLKEYRASINTYHLMMTFVPKHPLIWGNIGWSYYLLGNLDSAIVSNEHSLELDGSQAWVWGNQGLYMLAKGDIPRMQEAYAKVGSLVKDEESWKPIRDDLDTYCAEAGRKGCDEAGAAIDAAWLSALRRWYSETDPLLGEDLVNAHPEEYRKIHEMLGAEAGKAEGPEKDALTALRERLGQDLK